MPKSLSAYKQKRNFARTPEPAGDSRAATGGNSYVIQKHAARNLHYDFRLELDGVLKSWAVPEGPSLDAAVKRLAVHVEDHPLEYGSFEGVIPKGEYGGGTVMIWDRGSWAPEFDPGAGYKKGHLKFLLHGEKLKGLWHLVRMARKPREKQEAWLLFKSKDAAAREGYDILEALPRSVETGRNIEEIARDQDRVWSSKAGGPVPAQKAPAPRKALPKPKDLPKAVAGSIPSFIEPALPTTVEKAPRGGEWLHEIKYDGYRIQLRIEAGVVRMITRNGLDWTDRFRELLPAVAALPVRSAILDGEAVVQGDGGVPSFTALTERLKGGAGGLLFYAFDLLHLDGFDLRQTPLKARKAALATLLAQAPSQSIQLSEHIEGDGDAIFRHACRLGLEGIVSKKATAPYRSGRVNTWLKLKCARQAPFVIAGYTPSTVDKRAVAALALGEYVAGKLRASGHVGTGWSASTAKDLYERLDPIRTPAAPFADANAEAKGVRWVSPTLVADIEYRTRSGNGLLRHAVFKGLLEDTSASEATRDNAEPKPTARRPRETSPLVTLSNPGRLLWPEDGVTKEGLADFYTEIADWILPHIVDRPLSLLRCPGGIHAECFFQKHRFAGVGGAVRLVAIPGDTEPMLAIDGLQGLLQLVQAGVLEIHPWGSRTSDLEHPDRVTIDLDPGEGVPWTQMVEAANEVRQRLERHGIESFVKTTGGKGLHVAFPLRPKATWDEVKAFAQQIAERMAAEHPDRYVATMAKRARRGRIFVDYLRNGRGATAVATYSTRARPGAAVSTPLAWAELGPSIRANHFTVANLPKRLTFLSDDPWKRFASVRQVLPNS